jgi:hypothetical protein
MDLPPIEGIRAGKTWEQVGREEGNELEMGVSIWRVEV